MLRNQTCFQVNVTPNYKKRAPLEISPILILEKFKGTPSLLFKDVKVGASAVKGLWIENPNDCTVTAIFSKLPPAERGLIFSENEFILEANGSRRIEVKWTPTCEGSWRDVAQVQVWGLPPPHLSFRVILHLTSVQPKIKRKCCQMAPLRSRNALTAKERASSSQLNVRSGCCHSHPPSKAENGNGKENSMKKEPRLLIGNRMAKQQTLVDRDSLENESPPGRKNLGFVSMEDGLLPPCDVPLTPIRRSTYNINADQLEAEMSSHPLHTATFTIEEKEEALSNKKVRSNLGFLKALEENWSPVTFDKSIREENVQGINFPSTPAISLSPLNQWMLHPGPEQCSTEIKHKDVASSSETSSAKLLFPSMDVKMEENKNIPNESSPFQHNAAKHLVTPQCSPIPLVGQESHSDVADISFYTTAGYHTSGQRNYAEININVNINHTYSKDMSKDFEKEEDIQKVCSAIQKTWRPVKAEKNSQMKKAETVAVLQKACIVIQRKWRALRAKREAVRRREEILLMMNNACCVIQRSWRCYVARKLANRKRVEKLVKINNACCIIQRSWRLYINRKQAARERAEMFTLLNNASSIIQRSWRFYIARKQAARERAEIWTQMNIACCVIQRSWRLSVARKQATRERAEILSQMNKACCVIQRSWRLSVVRKQAAKERLEMWTQMNNACSVIQRSWRFSVARKQATRERAEILSQMNKACCVIQRSWRLSVVRKQAAKERLEMWTQMNNACSVIQRSWRFSVARKQATRERAEILSQMNKACCVIQRSWRLSVVRKQAAKERLEMWTQMNNACSVIQRSWRFSVARKQATRERAEILSQMNKACCVIQRSWRLSVARKQAAKERLEMWTEMNNACCVIQRSWRFSVARKQATRERAEILSQMNKACCVIQRSWRLSVARKQAAKERLEMWTQMNKACCVIQRSWRFSVVRKQTAKERLKMWTQMNNACSVIQRSWRYYAARKQAAVESTEILASIQTNFECTDNVNANGETVQSEKTLFELLEKFHLKPRAYELLFELADLHPLDDLYPALMHIQRSIKNGELKSKKSAVLLHCDKASQTDNIRKEFAKPVTRSQAKLSHSNTTSISCSSARRSLLNPESRKSTMMPHVGYLSPIKVKTKRRDVPEREKWSCVAEAVGRVNFTPQK